VRADAEVAVLLSITWPEVIRERDIYHTCETVRADVEAVVVAGASSGPWTCHVSEGQEDIQRYDV